MLPNEPEILSARQAFLDAQAALEGTGRTPAEPTGFFPCRWYGSSFHTDRGSYAVVKTDGELGDLVGDRLRLVYGKRSVIVYVFASADVEAEIVITRRSFAALELLAVNEIDVLVEVLR
jgi:hypothetical protein